MDADKQYDLIFQGIIVLVIVVAVIIAFAAFTPTNTSRDAIIADACVEDGVPQIVEVRTTNNRVYIVYKRSDGAYILQNAMLARDYSVLYYGECNGESANRAP